MRFKWRRIATCLGVVLSLGCVLDLTPKRSDRRVPPVDAEPIPWSGLGLSYDCWDREEVRSYWTRMEKRIYEAWTLPDSLPEGVVDVKIRFVLAADGSFSDVEILSAEDARLRDSAFEALAKATPLERVPTEAECLIQQPIMGTFRKRPPTPEEILANPDLQQHLEAQ